MNYKSAFIIYSFLLIAAVLTSIDVKAQDTSATSASKKITVTVAGIYCTNADYYGQVAEEKMPYVAFNTTVKFPFGGYVSGLVYKLLNDSAVISAGALTGGYEKNITEKLKADASFTHTFYPANSPFLQASNPDLASLSLDYTHLWNTAVTGDVAFGSNTDYFVTFSNYKSFDFTVNEKSLVSITPQADIIAGTQQFYETYQVNREKRNQSKGKGNVPPPKTVTTSYNRFGILSYNLKVPISYSRASYMVEAAAQLSVTGNNAIANAGKANTFFTLGVYYQF